MLSICPPVNIQGAHVNPYFHIFHMSTSPLISVKCPPVLPSLPYVHLSFHIFHMFTFTFIFVHYFTYTSKLFICPSVPQYFLYVQLSFISSICQPFLPYFPYVHLSFYINHVSVFCIPDVHLSLHIVKYVHLPLHIYNISTYLSLTCICNTIIVLSPLSQTVVVSWIFLQ